MTPDANGGYRLDKIEYVNFVKIAQFVDDVRAGVLDLPRCRAHEEEMDELATRINDNSKAISNIGIKVAAWGAAAGVILTMLLKIIG